MAKFTGLSLHALTERLGPPSAKTMQMGAGTDRHAFHLLWFCSGPNAPACFATAAAPDEQMPPNLTPMEQEFFDNAPVPKNGWTLKPCPQHGSSFMDFSEEPD